MSGICLVSSEVTLPAPDLFQMGVEELGKNIDNFTEIRETYNEFKEVFRERMPEFGYVRNSPYALGGLQKELCHLLELWDSRFPILTFYIFHCSLGGENGTLYRVQGARVEIIDRFNVLQGLIGPFLARFLLQRIELQNEIMLSTPELTEQEVARLFLPISKETQNEASPSFRVSFP